MAIMKRGESKFWRNVRRLLKLRVVFGQGCGLIAVGSMLPSVPKGRRKPLGERTASTLDT